MINLLSELINNEMINIFPPKSNRFEIIKRKVESVNIQRKNDALIYCSYQRAATDTRQNVINYIFSSVKALRLSLHLSCHLHEVNIGNGLLVNGFLYCFDVVSCHCHY